MTTEKVNTRWKTYSRVTFILPLNTFIMNIEVLRDVN